MDIILALATTLHLGLAGDYNEVHPSIQLRADNGLIAGLYHNSEDTLSVYTGYRSEWEKFFLELGVVAGYEHADIMPYGRVGYDFTDNLSVFAAPAFEVDNNDELTIGAVLGIEFSFKVN